MTTVAARVITTETASQEAEHLALRHVEAEIVERHNLAVGPPQAVKFERSVAAHLVHPVPGLSSGPLPN
jgi:hypothetical protein